MAKFKYLIRRGLDGHPLEEVYLEESGMGIHLMVGDFYVATLLDDGSLMLADIEECDVNVKRSGCYIKCTKGQ